MKAFMVKAGVITNVADYKDGKEASLRFLVGQVIKLGKGKANPGLVNDLLKRKLA